MANRFEILIAATDKATSVIRKVKRALGSITEPISKLSKSVKSVGRELGLNRIGKFLIGGAKSAGDFAFKITSILTPMSTLTGVGVIGGLALLTREWGLLGFEISRTSKTLGVSTQELQLWRATGKLMGVTAEEMTAGMKSLGDTLQDAKYGRNPGALMLLNRMHIGVHRLKDGSVDTGRALMDMAKWMPGKSAQVQGLVARAFGVEQLLPVLREGPAALKKYQDLARSLNAVQTPDQIKAAEELGKSFAVLDVSLDGLKNSIATQLVPTIKEWINGLAGWIGKNKNTVASDINSTARLIAHPWDSLSWAVSGWSDDFSNMARSRVKDKGAASPWAPIKQTPKPSWDFHLFPTDNSKPSAPSIVANGKAAPAAVRVTIEHKNPPAGTQMKVTTQGNVTATAHIERSMTTDGP